MDRVAAAFGFPFRPGAARAWLIGIPLVVLLPFGLVPLLGYSVAVVRSAAADPEAGPPPWGPLPRLLGEGLAVAMVLAVLTAPFAAGAALLAPWITAHLAAQPTDTFIRAGLGLVLAGAAAALPWGILLLVLMPPATARFARTGSLTDLIDPRPSLGTIGRRFPTWNLAVVAIVTAWGIGFCGLGLALLGVVPGVLYAMLVSAHATATLADG